MIRVLLAGAALLSLLQSPPAARSPGPVVRVADANSLKPVMQFGPANAKLHGLSGGEIFWRADIDLLPHAAVQRVGMRGYAPVFLQLKDGRCFEIDLESDIRTLTSAHIDQIDCRKFDSNVEPAPAPTHAGFRFVGRAWDLYAWQDARSGKVIFVPRNHPDATPLLTTRMRVLGLGAMGAPDAPMTEITLVGYIGRQLTLATVMLYYP